MNKWSPGRRASIEHVFELAAEAFQPSGAGQVGLELEWLMYDESDRNRPVPVSEVKAIAERVQLSAGGVISYEPGGQLELSTLPATGPQAALDLAAADELELRKAFAKHGLVMIESGLDTLRPPVRSLDLPRYRAMEEAFDRRGSAGRVMMNSTASLQINVDFGPDPQASWTAANAVAPVLAAMFANSAVPENPGQPEIVGGRQKIWSEIDPTRTEPVQIDGLNGPEAWALYALNANVLLMRGESLTAPPIVPFDCTLQHWIERGHDGRYPTFDDVVYHFTTLFPPVRPRKWLEFRMIDAVPEPRRTQAVMLAWEIVEHPEIAVAAAEVCGRIADPWTEATRGLAHPLMAEAAQLLSNNRADSFPHNRA